MRSGRSVVMNVEASPAVDHLVKSASCLLTYRRKAAVASRSWRRLRWWPHDSMPDPDGSRGRRTRNVRFDLSLRGRRFGAGPRLERAHLAPSSASAEREPVRACMPSVDRRRVRPPVLPRRVIGRARTRPAGLPGVGHRRRRGGRARSAPGCASSSASPTPTPRRRRRRWPTRCGTCGCSPTRTAS